MPTIHLEYFAILRDQTGRAAESRHTSAPTLAALYDELGEHYRFTLPRNRVRVAVDAAFASWDHTPADGETIVFIPPVSGG